MNTSWIFMENFTHLSRHYPFKTSITIL